jgi:hypothetical protein
MSECNSRNDCDVFFGGKCDSAVGYMKNCNDIGSNVCKMLREICEWSETDGCVDTSESKGQESPQFSWIALIVGV